MFHVSDIQHIFLACRDIDLTRNITLGSNLIFKNPSKPELGTGGKPSTRLPPEGPVEQSGRNYNHQNFIEVGIFLNFNGLL